MTLDTRFFYAQVDVLTDTSKVSVHFIIRDTNHLKISAFQLHRSQTILLDISRIKMLGTIQLNHQTCIMTVKIYDISVYDLLPQKAYMITSKKIIPQMPFLFGHILPQCTGIAGEIGVMFSIHAEVTFRPPGSSF